MANQYDASVDYTVNAHVTMTAYCGYAQGKAAMHVIYPKGTDGRFGYLEATYKF